MCSLVEDARDSLRRGIAAFRKGRESFEADELMRAKDFLAKSVRSRPSAEGYFFLANTLSMLARPRSAIRAYSFSLRLNPDVPAVHQNIAQLYDEVGNRSAAFRHYREWTRLEPKSSEARKALAMSHMWFSQDVEKGADLCEEASALAPLDPTVPFDCAQSLTLLLPPMRQSKEANSGAVCDEGGAASAVAANSFDGSSSHYLSRILPLFQQAQRVSLQNWRGGPSLTIRAAATSASPEEAQWSRGPACTTGTKVLRDWSIAEGVTSEILTPGGEVYGQQFPEVFGGPFSWAGQRYAERGIHLTRLKNVVLSGNEGVITRGCEVFVPYYDAQVPWHENLPGPEVPGDRVPVLPAALWLLVMFPANFFSFLIDEMARLAVWLRTTREKLPLLVPADRGTLKGFMYDWLSLFGDFEVVPYNILPHFMGMEQLAAPRLVVRELHVVDWHDAPSVARRGDVFLLPPRAALQQLRDLGLQQAGIGSRQKGTRRLLWISRSAATTRRVVNEDALMSSFRCVLNKSIGRWVIDIFSDIPPLPSAKETVRLFNSANIVVGFHGSGQANQVFCRSGTGVIDINLPEPHSQYTAHNSYALDMPYRLVMMQGVGLHQAVNITVPVGDVEDALRSLLSAGAGADDAP